MAIAAFVESDYLDHIVRLFQFERTGSGTHQLSYSRLMQEVERNDGSSRQTIVLRPQKMSDFEGELAGIAAALASTLPDVTVEVTDPLKSPPGTFLPPEAVHVLTAILPFAAGYSFDKAADLIVEKLRAGLRRKPDGPKRVLEIYGPDGRVLRRVEVSPDDHSDAGAED
jgi:hypothetical protein